MITIDQLLESVDLDFEPRWVTKDEDGTIICWAGEPRQSTAFQEWIQTNPYCCGKNIETRLKLAEFDGKDWTECVYEVPRKATDQIEKIVVEPHERFEPVLKRVIETLNAVVDAVNELKGAKNENI